MSWKRALFLAGAVELTISLIGCSSSDSNKKSDDTGDEGAATGDEGNTPADAGKSALDAGKAELDAASNNPPPRQPLSDAAVVKLPDGAIVQIPTGSTGAPTQGSMTDPSSGNTTIPTTTANLVPLPDDGKQLSICYDKSDCMGVALVCAEQPVGTIPGYCTGICAQSSAAIDCPPIHGIAQGCGLDGSCFVDCSGNSNKGDGACPDKMECRDTGRGGLFDPKIWRCGYPEGGGKKTVDKWGQCDASHANGDCKDLAICHTTVLGVVQAVTDTAYCAPPCTQDSNCALEGSTATPICWLGACELDCSPKGATCPDGMNCRNVDDGRLVETFRCIYIN